LRKQLSAERTHLVIEQVDLRQRAKEKFSHGDRMFFTRQSLEQATDEQIAVYKAERFVGRERIADFCCGIGGDLMALASIASAVGVDMDPVVALLADANCRTLGHTSASVEVADVRSIDVGRFDAWHLDPDRRLAGQRTTRLEQYEPPLEWINENRSKNPHLAVKLAPATEVPPSWAEEAELCWIGSRRECRQQVAWWGDLARHPGQRTVVIFSNAVGGTKGRPIEFIGRADIEPAPIAFTMGRYVYEPHSAILAAGLADCLATSRQLERICEAAPYFTSDELVHDQLLDAFEVRDVLPLDIKKLNSALAAMDLGEVEIKKRVVDITPEQLRKRLRLNGKNRATLIIVPTDPVKVAVTLRVTSLHAQ
jgi:hypothetical protein